MSKNNVDIRALAKLARLDVTDEELAKLEKEIPDILAFVQTIQKAVADMPLSSPSLRNVMRADENPHGSEMYTEKLIKAAPASENNRIVVKQVISRKKGA